MDDGDQEALKIKISNFRISGVVRVGVGSSAYISDKVGSDHYYFRNWERSESVVRGISLCLGWMRMGWDGGWW